MSYAVRSVCNRRTMRDFLTLPDRIYRGDANYVAPLKSEVRRTLDREKNPYFHGTRLELFVCYSDGVPISRAVAVINPRHEQKFGERTAFFGFFESMNDAGAVGVLFGALILFCRGEGATLLEGPFNPNHYSELGVLLDHFDRPPAFFQTYNPPYYPALLERAGFHQTAVLFTARNEHVAEYVDAHFDLASPFPVPDGYTIRNPDLRNLSQELEKIRLVFNDAFESNWHFLPASKEEYDFSVKFLDLITDPSLICIAEHHGEPVGVLMCVLDVNPLLREFHGRRGPLKLIRFLRGKKHIRSLIVYAVGIKRRYQHTRVYPLLYEAGARIARRFGSAECTWVSEGNMLARRSAERLGMEPDKHFAIYSMPLIPAGELRPISDKRVTYEDGESRMLPLATTTEVHNAESLSS
jgi:hypothetical protein